LRHGRAPGTIAAVRYTDDTDENAVTARPRRPPPVATPLHLRTVAEGYVQRFWAPAASLRRVLMRHLDRSVRFHGTDRTDGVTVIETILREFAEAGMVDDARFADGAARTLHARGRSHLRIGLHLRARGLGEADVSAAIAGLQADSLSDREAAFALARRRRLGPYRRADRADFRQKDLQAMARAGFAFSLAREVVDSVIED
jgi:regulatory protein